MDSQNFLVVVNILVTVAVGIILLRQISAQKSIMDRYKDILSVLDTKAILSLKDEEIKQVKKNMSNDINILQTQVSELSTYVNHVFDVAEETVKESDFNFDRDAFINTNLPNCRDLINH